MAAGEVVSVSLGDPSLDATAGVTIAGERYRLRRVGTGGDVRRAARLIRDLDGKVAALGLGGANRALVFGRWRYVLPQGEYLARQARSTPVADGSGWKAAVEPALVAELVQRGFPIAGRVGLVTSALDRFWLARALADAGCRVRCGDAYYALRLPFLFPSLAAFSPAAAVAMPLLRLLPLGWLYPLGDGQRRAGRGARRLLAGVDLLAGDWHLMRRFLPADLSGKSVFASTVTPGDRRLLAERGLADLVRLSPPLHGRSFGANLWEALVSAACGRRPADLRAEDYIAVWRAAGGGADAQVEVLKPKRG